ncbi:hypothetical protein [Sphingomonas sp. BAUL-RG-20F-R05-02]|uniref:hypothetical protein n=1 Tax=Sphingomonas sp. BAUL-RG-20F-R05-02 TaxID=2914830 RepID=UPI001F5881C1|nr:hypothetical protein [Sphingomonas sp. BAUL-RG-20F-R05-02]
MSGFFNIAEAAAIMAQALSTTPPTESRPADYVIADGVMRPLHTWKRDNRATFARMMLVAGTNVMPADVAGWTDEQVQQADCWAFSTHLSASDHEDIQVPERPSFIPFARRVTFPNRSTGSTLQ